MIKYSANNQITGLFKSNNQLNLESNNQLI